jgi:hypothetical protein
MEITKEMIDSIQKGFGYKFKTEYSDMKRHNGKIVTVVKIIDKPDEYHDEDCLPMYVVQTDSLEEFEAYPEELLRENLTYNL